MAQEQTRKFPVLYNAPVGLSSTTHANLRVARDRNYAYARGINAVPVVMSEIPRLLPHYPVVFASGEDPILIALLGVRADQNLFVDAAGNWAPNTYIPAYVRRYPFIAMEIGNDRYALGAELDPAFFVPDGEPLFENGKAAKAAELGFRFCMELHKAFEETLTFCRALNKAKVLRGKVFTVNNPTAQKLRLAGFSAVDEEALDALDTKTFNSWRKQHWLKNIYCHIASLDRLQSFPERLHQRIAA
jgi:hypothetical protein